MSRFWSYLLTGCLLVLGALSSREQAEAQNPDFPGYLGVYVQEDDWGMEITGFIRKTPAAKMAARGDISEGDSIVKLAGKSTGTLQELRRARNSIPYGKEGRMVLRDTDGNYYHVWISRNRPAPGVAAAAAPADTFGARAKGAGDGEEDVRDIKGADGEEGPSAPPPDDDNPDVRDK